MTSNGFPRKQVKALWFNYTSQMSAAFCHSPGVAAEMDDEEKQDKKGSANESIQRIAKSAPADLDVSGGE